MALPTLLANLPLPVIGAPLFIISNPKLVIAQCTAGIVGSMPALNARPAEQLEPWLAEITEGLAAWNRQHPDRPAAPFAINQIVHKSNDRLEHDMMMCAKYKVPIVITSLGARTDVNDAVHGWGGIVLHDIINNTFAHSAMSCSRRSLLLCTIWLIANGAAGRSGCARSCAASVSVISASHSSSSSAGRAFSAGIAPTMPALHCSITSLGLLMMNSGEPITGSGRFCRTGGSDKAGLR